MYFNIKNILYDNGFNRLSNNQNIYLSLYEAIKNAIISRAFEENLKLPPTRVLANDLGISRSTVIKAYDLLVLEKFIKVKSSSGYFVNPLKQKKFNYSLKTDLNKGGYPKISKKGKSYKKNLQIKSKSKKGIAFRPGLPPLDIFPVQQWKKLSNDYWKTVRASQLSYANTLGLESLRKNISNYLKIYRNIHCNYNQIIITTGSLHSLYLVGNVLIDNKDDIVIENPTYPHAFNLFNSLNANIHPTEIDSEGIDVSSITCKKPKLIYTTPSNQYPKGVKMSVSRRLELLKYATNNNSIIIEDDYDHEFSNWENPASSIYSLDRQSRVVYLGTFNKLMHPSIRIGYMIIPEYLIDSIEALYEQSSRFVSSSLQKTLSDFIEGDYLNKHLRKVLQVSIDRKKFFLKQFENTFENDIQIQIHNSGLHIIGSLPKPLSDIELSNFLLDKGIVAHPYSNYFIGNKTENGLVMGYSSVNKKIIKDTILLMKQGVEEFKNS